MDTVDDDLQLPRGNPVPMIVASVAAVVILGGLVLMLFVGNDDGEVPDISDPDPQASSASISDGAGPVPEVAFEYFDGGEGSLADFEGTPVVLNFFAEWCAPCVAEMPDLQLVSEEYEGQVAFLGLDTNDTLEKGREIADETGVTYTLAHDPSGDAVALAFELRNMPTTVFIDEDGQIVRSWTGRIYPDELRQIIDQDLVPDDQDEADEDATE